MNSTHLRLFNKVKSYIFVVVIILTLVGWIISLPTFALMISVLDNDVLYWRIAVIYFIEVLGGPISLILLSFISGNWQYPAKG